MHKRFTFRAWTVLGIASLAGLFMIQVYWFAEAYSSEQKHLSEQIALALRDLANRVTDVSGDRQHPARVQKRSGNRFELSYGSGVEYGRLDTLVRATFADHELLLPFELVAYDRQSNFLFGNIYDQGARSSAAMCLDRGHANEQTVLIAFTFPGQTATIIGGMELWIFSASVFMVILGGTLVMMMRLSRLKQRAEWRADMVSNMTHELQTPIANIALASEVLRKGIDGSPRSLHYANIISSENERLRSHIDQVLQTAVLEKGELALTRHEVNINDVVEEICSVFNERIQQRGGKLSLDIQATRSKVFADELHLRNLLYNLLDNAEKYSPASPEITVSTADHPDSVSVSVCDNGMGIDRALQSKIFERFFRASKGNVHDIKGFGLGLTYVKGIVEAHNGTVTVSSTPGHGSRFEVVLQTCA